MLVHVFVLAVLRQLRGLKPTSFDICNRVFYVVSYPDLDRLMILNLQDQNSLSQKCGAFS